VTRGPSDPVTADRLRLRAQRWARGEIERCACALGPRWAEHRGWVHDYLRAELLDRVARWRARRA
jgi:hypothetical protein